MPLKGGDDSILNSVRSGIWVEGNPCFFEHIKSDHAIFIPFVVRVGIRGYCNSARNSSLNEDASAARTNRRAMHINRSSCGRTPSDKRCVPLGMSDHFIFQFPRETLK